MKSTQLYHDLMERLSCGVCVVGADERVLLWNEWMTRATGVSEGDAVGRPFFELFPEASDRRGGQAVRGALTSGRCAVLSCAIHEHPLLPAPTAPPHSVTIHALAEPDPRALLVIRDTTAESDYAARLDVVSAENAAQQQALLRERDRFTHVTHFDPVTGLANRHKVRNHLAGALVRCVAQNRMGALLMIDLDRFGDINSSVGSERADQVLRTVASRLADSVRPPDTVARLGGDEFAVVLDRIDSIDDAERMGFRLMRAFDRPFMVEGQDIFLTGSVGVTVFPMEDCTADRLLTNAETAVGIAKKQGSGGFQIYSDRLDAEVAHRMSMQAALRRAVDNEEFVLVYQPQVGYALDRPIGVEALLRWVRPDGTLVSPGEFIPLLEESGLITRVGAWVLWEACRQGMSWRSAGLGRFRVSVNVSARQFQEDILQRAVAHALSETGFPAEDLELELTESLLMKDVGSSKSILADLKQMGVRVAIDDFGTGYSSLAYLRRFPVDTLKIDRDFTRNLTDGSDDLAICKTIVSLGKVLELEVLAEGVETREQLDLLEGIDCSLYQGYFFGRPMTPDRLEGWISLRTPGAYDARVVSSIVSGDLRVITEKDAPDDCFPSDARNDEDEIGVAAGRTPGPA